MAENRPIVLVEDNPADARLVRKALEQYKVEGELVVLADGEKAIEFIRALDGASVWPRLFIIDLNLPMRPGQEVLETIRRTQRWSNVPAIVLSSSDAHPDRVEAAALGASQYIKKPTRLDEFLRLGAIFRDALAENQ